MIDPILTRLLVTTIIWGVCGSALAVVLRLFNSSKEGPRIDQTAAVGFLVGAAFGAFFAVFNSMLVRP